MADTTWTLKAALDWTRDYLAEKGDSQPRLSAEWLLSAATGLSRVEIYAFHERPLTLEERASLRESVRRRAAGEPLQYISGEMAFRHLVVKVKPGVLIPRPETEVLVDAVLPAIERAIAERGEALVADLCTGSGCVALSIAQECGQARVWATDVSPLAVDVALANRLRLALAERINVLEGDLFSPIAAAAPHLRGHVDAVVANPPYIPSADLPTLPAEVLGYEPGARAGWWTWTVSALLGASGTRPEPGSAQEGRLRWNWPPTGCATPRKRYVQWYSEGAGGSGPHRPRSRSGRSSPERPGRQCRPKEADRDVQGLSS